MRINVVDCPSYGLHSVAGSEKGALVQTVNLETRNKSDRQCNVVGVKQSNNERLKDEHMKA